MGNDARSGGSRRGLLALGLGLGVLLVASLTFRALTPWSAATVFAAASALAGLVSGAAERRIGAALVIAGVLTWAGEKSDLRPLALIQQRERAAEYLFGRSLTEKERAEARSQAERLVQLRVEADSRSQAAAELPAEAEPAIRARAAEIAAERLKAMPGDEWSRRVGVEEQRILLDKKGGYFPPDVRPDRLRQYLSALVETIAIAIWGTLIAVVLSLPFGLLGSHRTLEILLPGSSALRRWTRWGIAASVRRLFDASRGFNEFVLALIFVAILGLGPFAGTLALAVHTFGVLGKVFADAFDTTRRGEVEGVQAAGAGPLQVVSWAVIPQMLPILVSQSLLRFESNVRSASVLGLVGAGGIGFLIDAKLKAYQFREVATMMILIIIVVAVIDFACTRANRKLA